MAIVRLSDIIEPTKFTDYIVQNTMTRTALMQSGVMTRNSVIDDQITAGAHSFTVPIWNDLSDDEADIISDDPNETSTPRGLSTDKQVVRKAFLHGSWSAMNLASEIAGDDALNRVQNRVQAYWDRQLQKRLVATLNGVLADNQANHGGDMVLDISGETGDAASFSAEAVIETTGTMGDAMQDVTGIAMHSDIYRAALKNDLIEFVPDSQGALTLPTFRGLAVVMDDALPVNGESYTTVLFGRDAVGFGVSAPRVAEGTEVESLPSSGNGGGQQVLHSRINAGVHPAGFSWKEATIAGESPTIAELADATNWERVAERKATPLAFLVSKV
ncbi:hypothetical protein CK501_05630 [Halovibrio salipaludis]|uniref:Coat protein n=1 Tax=Halovibrio salipaludis TaxID=2032626 RepID=A0A2A2F8Z4_9GAMM|nr:major capsid protein [Halovibrio salipaludis]PAU81043.1 hypothetical protein CK501_05630 [Halovibrio salipaludis]